MSKSIKALIALAMLSLSVGCSKDTPTFSVLPETNKFIQDTGTENYAKIDVLWIIDNSGSMRTSQEKLADNFNSFISKFISNGYDFQIAVTVTDAYRGGANYAQFKDGHYDYDLGQWVRTGVRIIDQNTPDPVPTFMDNVMQGTRGSGWEKGMDSLETSLNLDLNAGFPRADSFLAVIIVSDEDDSSTNTVDYTINYLNQLTNTTTIKKNFSVSAMMIMDDACASQLGRPIGAKYASLVDSTGGVKGSLCKDFANDLTIISDEILQLSNQFYLERTPKPETIKVYIDAVEIPKASENQGPSIGGWEYNAETNSIIFMGDHIPAQGANINVIFDTLNIEE